MRDPVRLQMTTADNNNKFYNMDDLGNGYFEAHWGRVDSAGSKKEYPISEWDKIKKSKIAKGYVDISDKKITKQTIGIISVNDPNIQVFLDRLYQKSRQYSSQYYNIETAISKKQIDEAQEKLNLITRLLDDTNISDSNKVNRSNKLLLEIFTILPRKIKKVQDELIESVSEIKPRVTKEQNLLNNLSVQAIQPSTTAGTGQTYFDLYEFNVAKISDAEFDMIAKRLDKEANATLLEAWSCRKKSRDDLLEDYLKNNNLVNNKDNVKLYWHGTREENVFSIMANGLFIRPTNVITSGSAFGTGIYSGPKANKSLNYTGYGNEAYLFLNAVVTGNMFKVHDNYDRLGNIRVCDLDGNKFSQNNLGYHSVYAEANKSSYIARDECIVYNQDQVASRYVCKVRK